MYSERSLELFHSRAHAGNLPDATHYGESGVPGQGPYIRLWLRVEGEVVRFARYKTFGCPAVIACAEAASAWCEGESLASAIAISEASVFDWVGGVPEGKEHCPQLVALAFRSVRRVDPITA